MPRYEEPKWLILIRPLRFCACALRYMRSRHVRSEGCGYANAFSSTLEFRNDL